MKKPFSRKRQHGLSTTVEYRAWLGIQHRCSNPNMVCSKDYIERGIKVCERWRVFEHFIADVGLKPSPKHSIDRINNDGHYSCGKCEQCLENEWPLNVRWATSVEQNNNKRNTRILELDGVRRPVMEWAAIRGIPAATIRTRLHRGNTDDEALRQQRRRVE